MMPRAGPRPASGPWRARLRTSSAFPWIPGTSSGWGATTRRGFRIVREYARHWEQMAEGGHGLVLIGPPGTGKTFAAGCLANFLIHDGKVPLVTQRLQGGKRALGRQRR